MQLTRRDYAAHRRCRADSREAAELLLTRGADPHAKADIPHSATLLMGAAINGNDALVRALLARQVNVAVTSAPVGARAKNGPVVSAMW